MTRKGKPMPRQQCELTGCHRPTKDNNSPTCLIHYGRMKTRGINGAPNRVGQERKIHRSHILALLDQAIEWNDPTVCLLWPYVNHRTGYGEVWNGTRKIGAHRAVLEVVAGQPAPGMHAAHDPYLCDERACVNPLHLRWATPSENHRDRARRKRWEHLIAIGRASHEYEAAVMPAAPSTHQPQPVPLLGSANA